jgi:hypothetical protein
MPSIISTKTSGGGGIAVTGDTSGVLELQSNNGTTAVTISTGQVVSFVNNFGTVAGYPSYQCRAWVNFNGTGTVAIRGSANVSSITDNGTGNYTVNFSTAMPDADYAYPSVASFGADGALFSVVTVLASSLRFTTDYVINFSADTLPLDSNFINVAIFR